ncbi:MAG: AAA family ATPase, partial [Clostridiales bacterium]|nr:AAA family ATPase [Clostridiales bacterium]
MEKYIKRDRYLTQLINRKENGLVKVITGIRRCGKSFLLFNLYYDHLISEGVPEDHIITIALDDDMNVEYRNPTELSKYVRSRI